MIQTVSSQDPALQPAAAAARQLDAGVEATRKALDEVRLEGTLAVQLIKKATEATAPGPDSHSRGGGNLDLIA